MPDAGRDRLGLIEILDSAGSIHRYIAGFDDAAFLADQRTCDAVTMHVMVIGEAVGRLSEVTRAALGPFQWDLIRGVRNRIAHGYASVDFTRLWTIATQDIPPLAEAVRRVLGDDPDAPARP